MDAEYRAYFTSRTQQLLAGRPWDEQLGRPVVFPEDRAAHDIATGAVESARGEAREGAELRPDAELALYLLASELVARPVLAVEPSASDELRADLASDAAMVVRVAASRLEQDREISAHAVIDGLSQNWSELRTARWRLWDRYSD